MSNMLCAHHRDHLLLYVWNAVQCGQLVWLDFLFIFAAIRDGQFQNCLLSLETASSAIPYAGFLFPLLESVFTVSLDVFFFIS